MLPHIPLLWTSFMIFVDSTGLFSSSLLFSKWLKVNSLRSQPHLFQDCYLPRNSDVLKGPEKLKFYLEGKTSQLIGEVWSLSIVYVRQTNKGKDCPEDKVDCACVFFGLGRKRGGEIYRLWFTNAKAEKTQTKPSRKADRIILHHICFREQLSLRHQV